MDENRRLIKNTGIIAIGNMSTKLVSFLLLPLYTALLSADEYGICDYIFSIAIFCVPFVSMLMDESIFRFLIDCNKENEREKIISTSVSIVLVGMIIFSVIGITIMNYVHYSYTYYTAAYILLAVVSGMLGALLRGIGRTDQYALFNFGIGSIQIFLNILFIAVLNLGLIGMLLASILSQLLVAVFFIFKIKVWKYLKIEMIDLHLAKIMVSYSLPLIPNKISWTIINLSDRIIIMNILGSGSAGLYAVSHKFPNLMDTVYGFFYQSWKESSSRVMGDESQESFYNSVYGHLKNFMYAIVIGMITFMPIVFKILINKSYYGAIYYVPILLLATYFANISGFYGGIFTAYKDTKIMGTTTMAAAVINLVLHFALIFLVGMYAAAISTLVANFSVYIYRRIKVRKYIVLHEDWKNRMVSILVTVVILLMFYNGKTVWVIVSCAIAVFYAVNVNWKLIAILWKQFGRWIYGCCGKR